MLVALALGLSGAPSPLRAQDGRALDARENPFLPNTTEEEDKRIAERERMRQVFREMMPEVKSVVQAEINSLRQQVADDARKSAVDTLKSDPTLQALQSGTLQVNAGAPQAQAAAVAPAAPVEEAETEEEGIRSKLPDGAKFVACVNQKAMYRDPKDGISFFYVPPKGQPSYCGG